jgi:hypothetical protein
MIPDDEAVAKQLGINFEPDLGETLDIAPANSDSLKPFRESGIDRHILPLVKDND